MALTFTIDGVDVSDKVRLDGYRLVMAADQGKVGAGRLFIDDTSGSGSYAPITKEWSVVESTATPTTIAGGFVAERGIDRGPLTVATQRQFGPILEDWNTVLTDRVLKGPASNRPAETDRQRVMWLLGQGVLGMLDGAGQVPNTNTVDMPKTDYWGKTPLDVLDDCAEASGKNFYVYYEAGTGWVLFYDRNNTDSAFTSGLQISDDSTDIDNSTVFGASNIKYEEDPERIYSGLLVKYDGGQVWAVDETTETTYRRLQRTVIKENFKKAATAQAWADRQLAKLNEPTKRLTLTVSVPASALGDLRPGLRIEVKLRSRGITAFTYFRIVETTITPRQGIRGLSDVEFDVELKMKDKIRPVNLDDTFGGGDSSGNKGTGGSSGGSVGGSAGGTTTDTAEYPLDDFSRATGGGAQTSTGTGTSMTLNIPDGANVSGRMLMMQAVWDSNTGDYDTQVINAGFSRFGTVQANGSYRYCAYTWEMTGGEGFTGAGDTVALSGYTSANVLAFVDIAAQDVGAEAVIDWDATSDPPDITSQGWAAGTYQWYTFLITDDAGTITAGPSGYTESGDVELNGVMRMAAWTRQSTVDAESPGAFTEASNTIITSVTIGQGSGALSLGEGWGSIPEGVDTGAPWEGGNTWAVTTTSGTASFSVSGSQGLIVITADDTTAIAELTSDGEPTGPWDTGDAAFTIRWQTDVLGDITDTDANSIEFNVYADGWFGGLVLALGDNVTRSYMSPNQQRGIVVWQGTGVVSSSSFVPKTLAVDTDYYIKLDARGTRVRAKMWKASDSEPVAWDIDVARVDTAGSGETMDITVDGNITGGDVTHRFESIDVELNGSGVTTLPPGDGATVTWTIEEWVPGTLRVFVDGIQTIPASTDRANGTFTFDRAPDLGAVIRVEYQPA